MSKKLAIKGHPTRGKEVIKLLEMMGGKNKFDYNGECTMYSYYVSGRTIFNDRLSITEDDDFVIFNLEEFLEKYPFKVGDIVDRALDYVSCVIDSMRWNSEKCCVEYHLNFLNGSECGWHVSECLNKPENSVIMGDKIESTGFMQMGKTCGIIFNEANYEDEVELQLGNYEIEVRDGKTYAVFKKPKYPKTYDECCDMLNANEFVGHELMRNFPKLINARNAYWQIAGEELGLGEPWEPKYEALVDNTFFTIQTFNGEIDKSATSHRNSVLAFPTMEIRDVFYENFKELIEKCKELL